MPQSCCFPLLNRPGAQYIQSVKSSAGPSCGPVRLKTFQIISKSIESDNIVCGRECRQISYAVTCLLVLKGVPARASMRGVRLRGSHCRQREGAADRVETGAFKWLVPHSHTAASQEHLTVACAVSQCKPLNVQQHPAGRLSNQLIGSSMQLICTLSMAASMAP